MADEKPVIWIGSSLKDLRAMSEGVQDIVGFALDRVQRVEPYPGVKSLKGLPGVQEIRADVDTDTYRAVYAVNLGNVIYMLHVFQKKSKRGAETPKPDMDLIRARLKRAQEDADERGR